MVVEVGTDTLRKSARKPAPSFYRFSAVLLLLAVVLCISAYPTAWLVVKDDSNGNLQCKYKLTLSRGICGGGKCRGYGAFPSFIEDDKEAVWRPAITLNGLVIGLCGLCAIFYIVFHFERLPEEWARIGCPAICGVSAIFMLAAIAAVVDSDSAKAKEWEDNNLCVGDVTVSVGTGMILAIFVLLVLVAQMMIHIYLWNYSTGTQKCLGTTCIRDVEGENAATNTA